MKKRNLFLALVMSLVMMLTACGNSNPFVGTWVGTWDMTDIMYDSIQGSGMEEYADFEGLELQVVFTFDDEEVEFAVDEDSLEALGEKMEEQMIELMDAYLEDMASDYGYSSEDLLSMMGYTHDEFVDEMVAAMDVDGMIDSLSGELEAEGTYEYDEEDGVLTIEYDDDNEEEFEYEFDDDKLIITMEADGYDVVIECEKE